MIGVKPFRIDVLTKIDGVSFERAWRDRVRFQLSMGKVPFISRPLLIQNKRAADRGKDRADLALLGASPAPRRRRRTKR